MCPNSMHSNIRISTNYANLDFELLKRLYDGDDKFFDGQFTIRIKVNKTMV